jgi:hypothetical protein
MVVSQLAEARRFWTRGDGLAVRREGESGRIAQPEAKGPQAGDGARRQRIALMVHARLGLRPVRVAGGQADTDRQKAQRQDGFEFCRGAEDAEHRSG